MARRLSSSRSADAMAVLRAVMTVLGILAIAGALVAGFCGAPFPTVAWLTGIGLMLTFGVVFERIHYKRLSLETPGQGWVATTESFVDPETGQLVQVHVRPDTGERLYVVVGAAPDRF